MDTRLLLHYREAARLWTDALPLGNGTLGAMCFGGVERERFQINDGRCWSGGPASIAGNGRAAEGDGPAVLQQVRRALAAGDVLEAERLSRRWQGGHSQSYQPLLDLWIEAPGAAEVAGYRRSLNLATAIASVSCSTSSASVSQEAFVSHPARVLVIHRSSTGPTALQIRLGSRHPLTLRSASDEGVELMVRMPSDVAPPHERTTSPVQWESAGSTSAAVVARILTDGVVTPGEERFDIADATELTVILATASDAPEVSADLAVAPHGDQQLLLTQARRLAARAASRRVDVLRAEHVADHASLFSRVELTLEDGPGAALPTDARVRRARELPDPGLAALAFAYGRYLMIAGSRPGSLPLTLQGIWNEDVRPAWSSNYTTNINTEMNYWLAEPGNLAECATPLHGWLERLSRSGERAARDLYAMDGWVAHHNSDRWGFALPAGQGTDDPSWSAWPMAGAWLSLHLWEHWAFTRDIEFLRTTAWPVMAGACRFLLEWLVADGDGRLATSPSTSPENKYLLSDGSAVALSTSTTADVTLLTELFSHAVEAMRELGLERQPLHGRLVDALARLPRIGTRHDGLVAEWIDDPPEQDPRHRHQSHLIGVYPGELITPDRTPGLAAAARRSLAARGRESTGWSLAWRIALHARLRSPQQAAETIDAFLAPTGDDGADAVSTTGRAGVYRNLFCAHPPFQIDGNFGFAAGVIELLLQSHAGEIDLLACLPPRWRSGSVRGLRARGGVSVDLRWAEGLLESATLTADRSGQVIVRYREARLTLDLPEGQPVTIGPGVFRPVASADEDWGQAGGTVLVEGVAVGLEGVDPRD